MSIPMIEQLSGRTRTYGGLLLGISLVVVGALATGILPSTTPFQVFAGGIIVAGFVVGYVSLGVFAFRE